MEIRLPGIGTILGKACRNTKGYLRFYTSKYRNKYVHRVIWELVSGKKIPDGHDIHHLNGRDCYCPWNLVCLEKALHPICERRRCPYTGKFVTVDEFNRILGIESYTGYELSDAPDWVTECH